MAEKRTQGRLRRRLTLSHDGRPFLDRWGIVHDRVGGFYIHHIAGPDPGLDMHDHPWWFITMILRGSYREVAGPTRLASTSTWHQQRQWRRWSVHVMPLHVAHRIVAADKGTWTLVVRGRTVRRWGFYLPDGWVDWERYDYDARRPTTITANK